MMVSCMEKEDTPPHFVHVESVAFNVKDGKLTLPETHTYQLEIIFTPADCGNKKVTWSNTDGTVATVSPEGLITAKSEGVTVIGIQTDDMRRKAEVEVTVTPFVAENPITSITLDRDRIEYDYFDDAPDEPVALKATIVPAFPTISTLEWTSSLFQWSRKADGHEQMLWAEEGGTLVNAPAEPDARVADRTLTGNSFIPVSAAPWDWAIQSSTDEAGL